MSYFKKVVMASAFFALVGFSASAQNGNSFGLRGGLNYSANGDYFESASSNAKNPDRNIGYHIGVFGKIGNEFFLKPELVYTTTKSDYSDDEFSVQKIDAPILFGVQVLGPLNVFAGPSFQYILDTEFDGIEINDVEEDFTVGLNFGVGLSFDNIGIDLRYERGFNENEATFIDTNLGSASVSRIDTRPDQLILSLSIAL
ncbi:outer membrane beta-barrel protein [Winogradskyella arenosi]|uniref:Outer membrane protein with beta-barrel domain n=1 Tax=Winogradskyella arenosi TaxID=533325 RepID=A0A368ZDC5_9FLAO|nr:outer membrane beta-barrel protein [Winogradskyella arenosi]RCW91198.1 outer membrane protein with beta-barrel domain [Winogradskyella arenosi]